MINRLLLLMTASFLCNHPAIAQDREYARAIVEELCAPEMHGRGYVDNGMGKAAGFLRDEFSAIGLQPLFKRSALPPESSISASTFLQLLTVPVMTYPGKMKVSLDGRKLRPGIDFHIYPGSTSSRTRVRPSYSADDPEILWLDGKAAQSANMAELMNRPGPPLLRLTTEKLTWALSQNALPRTGILIDSAAVPSRPAKIRLDIEAKHVPEFVAYNVAGIIPGKSDSIILITAHYDHLGRMGSETKSGAYFPGANDNASGTALMLDLARHYTATGDAPEFSMVFVAFGAEELGLLGSQHFVENPPFPLERIRFQINLDICGTGDDGIQVVNGKVLREDFDRLVAINDRYALLKKVKIRGESCNSDHCPFYLKGVPAFFIYTLGGARHYHDIFDTAEALSLLEFEDLHQLLTKFIDGF